MPASPIPATDRVPALLTWCGMAACVAGLVAHRMWQPLPFPRLFEFVLLALLALALAWPLQRLSRWKVAEATDVDDDARYVVQLRFRLDLSQLPRPFQIGAVGPRSGWNLLVSRTQALPPLPTPSAPPSPPSPQ